MRLEDYLSTFKRDLDVIIDEAMHEKECEYKAALDMEGGIYNLVGEIDRAYHGNKDLMYKHNFSSESYAVFDYILKNTDEYIFIATRPNACEKLEAKFINLLALINDENSY